MGIEPTTSAWEADVLPLYYTRTLFKPFFDPILNVALLTIKVYHNGMTLSIFLEKSFYIRKIPVIRRYSITTFLHLNFSIKHDIMISKAIIINLCACEIFGKAETHMRNYIM